MIIRASRFTALLGVAAAMGIATAGLLLAVDRIGLQRDVSSLLVVLSGMTAMATFSALTSYIQELRFSEPQLVESEFLITAVAASLPKSQQVPPSTLERLPPWEVSAAQFLGIDNNLALAKLRIDLERELRRVADTRSVTLIDRPLGINALARELMAKGALPENLYYPLREIADLCNRAVHGYRVDDEQARLVVTAGIDLLQGLRASSPANA